MERVDKVCNKCGKIHVIGSKKELKDLCGIQGLSPKRRPLRGSYPNR